MSEYRVQLAVIAKTPEPGSVKTRLCPPCTVQEAARIAGAALADTFDILLAVPATRHLLILDGEPGPWVPGAFEIVRQGDGALGHRLRDALETCFNALALPVIVVAMDTPQMSAESLGAAARALTADAGPDAILGPADDGGYWMIGLRRFHPEAFLDVSMSTDSTLSEQVRQLERIGYRVERGPRLLDFDDFAQALAVAEMIPRTRFARAVTEAADAVARRTSIRSVPSRSPEGVDSSGEQNRKGDLR